MELAEGRICEKFNAEEKTYRVLLLKTYQPNGQFTAYRMVFDRVTGDPMPAPALVAGDFLGSAKEVRPYPPRKICRLRHSDLTLGKVVEVRQEEDHRVGTLVSATEGAAFVRFDGEAEAQQFPLNLLRAHLKWKRSRGWLKH